MDINLLLLIGLPLVAITVAFLVYGRKKNQFFEYVIKTMLAVAFVFLIIMIITFFFEIPGGPVGQQLYIMMMTPFLYAIGFWIGGKAYGKIF